MSHLVRGQMRTQRADFVSLPSCGMTLSSSITQGKTRSKESGIFTLARTLVDREEPAEEQAGQPGEKKRARKAGWRCGCALWWSAEVMDGHGEAPFVD